MKEEVQETYSEIVSDKNQMDEDVDKMCDVINEHKPSIKALLDSGVDEKSVMSMFCMSCVTLFNDCKVVDKDKNKHDVIIFAMACNNLKIDDHVNTLVENI